MTCNRFIDFFGNISDVELDIVVIFGRQDSETKNLFFLSSMNR